MVLGRIQADVTSLVHHGLDFLVARHIAEPDRLQHAASLVLAVHEYRVVVVQLARHVSLRSWAWRDRSKTVQNNLPPDTFLKKLFCVHKASWFSTATLAAQLGLLCRDAKGHKIVSRHQNTFHNVDNLDRVTDRVQQPLPCRQNDGAVVSVLRRAWWVVSSECWTVQLSVYL